MRHGIRIAMMAAAATAWGVSAAGAEEESAWRLFVADHAAPVLHALDAATGEVLARFDLASPARLYATGSGRTVFAVQRDADRVSTFASGIEIGDHGDHGDLEVEAPRMLDVHLAGERPVHFVEHHGEVALFFDGEGVARILSESGAHEGAPEIREIAASAPHHGVAVPWGKHVILSQPDPQDASEPPIGVAVIDREGAQVGDVHACPGLHGEAASGNLLAIGCADGLLIVRSGDGAPTIEHLAYPDSLPVDAKVSSLVGGRGLQYFLGNFGAAAVVLVDPQDEDAFRYIELPMRRVDFAVDPVRAKFAYVFTEDGRLNRLNVLSGRITDSIALTDPYSMDGHWSDPRPRIAVAGGEIAVTDPLAGLIHMVDAKTFTKSREIAVDGKPYNLVAVGGSGAVHD